LRIKRDTTLAFDRLNKRIVDDRHRHIDAHLRRRLDVELEAGRLFGPRTHLRKSLA
jgi:hypothetical protein